MSKRRRADVRLVSEIEPASEPLPVSEDTPFVIGVLGNFAGRWASDAARGPSVADRPPLEVDRDNFDEIMKRLDVRFDASEPARHTARCRAAATYRCSGTHAR